MTRVFALLILALSAFAAQAATVELAYTLPTERIDDSPLAVADVQRVEVKRAATCDGVFATVATVAPTALTVSVTTPPGDYCFRVVVFDKLGQAAAPSNTKTVTVPAPPPAPKPATLDSAAVKV